MYGVPDNILNVIYPEFYEIYDYEELPDIDEYEEVNNQVDAIRIMFSDEGIKHFETTPGTKPTDPKNIFIFSNETRFDEAQNQTY